MIWLGSKIFYDQDVSAAKKLKIAAKVAAFLHI